MRSMAFRRWCAVSFFGRPKPTVERLLRSYDEADATRDVAGRGQRHARNQLNEAHGGKPVAQRSLRPLFSPRAFGALAFTTNAMRALVAATEKRFGLV
jgi:hypothetical protein